MKKEDLIDTEKLQFFSSIEPLLSKRVFEEIADQVKELIFLKALKSGDRLPAERGIAAHFASGRSSVREALRIIVMEAVMKFIHLFFGLIQPSYDFCCWHIAQHRTILNAVSVKDVSAAKE